MFTEEEQNQRMKLKDEIIPYLKFIGKLDWYEIEQYYIELYVNDGHWRSLPHVADAIYTKLKNIFVDFIQNLSTQDEKRVKDAILLYFFNDHDFFNFDERLRERIVLIDQQEYWIQEEIDWEHRFF